jgi:hypothetical protein
MGYVVVGLIILWVSMLAVLATWVVRRAIPVDIRRSHHEVGSSVFLQLGVIFAVVLAFVFNEVWSEHTVAAQAVNQECSSLHAVAMLATALPKELSRPLTRAIVVYIQTVVDDEWPVMAQRKRSEKASSNLVALWRVAADLQPSRPQDAAIQSQIMSSLAVAHQQRETRLFQMTEGLPPVLWALLIAFSIMLVGFVVFSGLEIGISQMIITAMCTAGIAFLLIVIELLDFPFEGPLRIQPTDFQETLARITGLIGVT